MPIGARSADDFAVVRCRRSVFLERLGWAAQLGSFSDATLVIDQAPTGPPIVQSREPRRGEQSTSNSDSSAARRTADGEQPTSSAMVPSVPPTRRIARPSTINHVHVMVEVYCAGRGIDRERDEADRRAQRRLAGPTLVQWAAMMISLSRSVTRSRSRRLDRQRPRRPARSWSPHG